MENRQMTEEERGRYHGAVDGFVMDSDSWEARLYVARPLRVPSTSPSGWSPEGEWYLYGDITAGFGLSPSVPTDWKEGDAWGNHRVREIIEESEINLTGVRLDPEGGCFFAYGDSQQRMATLAADINRLSAERRRAS